MGQNQSQQQRLPPANYDLPPLSFHSTHGVNITLTEDGATAIRDVSYCNGVLFTHRPVMVGERICLKIKTSSTQWSGALRIGFSANDPARYQGRLPKYACPDLVNKSGFWCKALGDYNLTTNTIFHYYVSSKGDVHVGVNGGDLGIFISGIDTRQPLWGLIDLYGNCTSIELMDSRRSVNNFSRSSNTNSNRSSFREPQQRQPWPNVPTHQIMPTTVALPPTPMSNDLPNIASLTVTPPRPVAQSSPVTLPATQTSTVSLTSNTSPRTSVLEVGTVPTLKYNQGVRFQAMTFHPNVGKNVSLDPSATVAARLDEEFAQGYVFSHHNITPGERIVIQVLGNEDSYIGSLAFGLTNCDPSTLNVKDLPEDSDLLLDRPEYWVVSKDVASCPPKGDELSFTIKTDGSVEFMRNNSIPSVFMHVDITQPLWAFWDIYGNTSRIRVLGSTSPNALMPRQVSRTSETLIEPASEASELNTSVEYRECIVCYEKAVDCVIYTCGHMCLCYECALQQWRGRGGGFCPICRLVIRDVIRTFKS
eukprot:01981.XXX_7785_9386_1 [CDS] Oithona nana genome sequencing.